MNVLVLFASLQLAVSAYGAVVLQDNIHPNANAIASRRSIVRVMPDGPKVAIKSTSISAAMKPGGGRMRNSDFHEVFLAPYRYLEKEMQATAVLLAANNEAESKVAGTVNFSQANAAGEVTVSGMVTGLTPGKHGLHIHEFGDVSDHCQLKKIGHHYNPFKFNHGLPSSRERHVGDLGNIEADDTGVAHFTITDSLISLVGGRSVIGRSIVIDRDVDNFSSTSKDAQPVACGVIGRRG